MGICIKLNILPNQISAQDWNLVYREAKQLINAYPFLDIVRDNESYNCSWSYADSPSEKPIEHCNNNLGFQIYGDLVTMEIAESFELVQDLDYYRGDSKSKGENSEEKSIDIFQLYTTDLYESASVFNSKTQGYDYHRYILAVACLIEDRLKTSALVHGDISKGQMESAVEWASCILEKPVQISERADNGKLLARVKRFEKDESYALRLFMELTLNEKDSQLGCFIRSNFSEKWIIKYYIEEISKHKMGTFGFTDILTEYLDLGNDLITLCDICVGKNSDADTIALFIKTIVKLGVHLKPEERAQSERLTRFKASDPSSRVPDTIDSMFEKISSLISFGNKRQSNIYVPLEELVEIFKEKFGTRLDVNAEVSKYIDKESKEDLKDPFESLLTENQKTATVERYDIESLDSLILWKPGLTIRPELEKFILLIKDFVEGDMPEAFKVLAKELKSANSKERMKFLITYNKYFLISKKNWDYIEESIEDFDFCSKIMLILLIDAEEIKVNRLALSLLNNNRLLAKYILNN